jgi:hypothetical protein
MIHYLARGMERITNLSILSECCLTPIIQLYHCENKFIFNDIMMRFAKNVSSDFFTRIKIFTNYTRIGGVMVSVLASSAVDRGFEPQ